MGNIGSSPTDNNWYYQSFFVDTDFIHLYLYTIIVTLFIEVKVIWESDYYKIIPEFTFTFIVKPTKLKQHEFKEQLYNKWLPAMGQCHKLGKKVI